MRHKQWEEVLNMLPKIRKSLGQSIYDNRCEKWWDVGQAICAEAYGPNWMNDQTFVEWDGKDDSEPPEPYYFDCAAKLASGYVPVWTEVQE